MARPSLLMLTAVASALSVVSNGMCIAAPMRDSDAGSTRLGSSIEQDMGARDATAVRRKRALDLREQATRAAEARLQADLTARQPATMATSAAPAGPNPADGAQYDDLARIYQAMKPARAAGVFEQLDMDVQMKVAQRMPNRATALILASMTPAGAAALSMSLARKRPGRPAGAAPVLAVPRR